MKKIITSLSLCLCTLIGTAQEIISKPDVLAEFPGGISGLTDYLKKNVKYPKKAEKAGVQGMVMVQFVVNTDGSISDPEAIRNSSKDQALADEALRVVKKMPKWTPGKKGGAAVKTKFALPINFRLPDSKGVMPSDEAYMATIDFEMMGKKDTPLGLYRLLKITYDEKTILPDFERYKYCAEKGTLQLEINRDEPDVFHMMLRKMEDKPVTYTGNTPQGEDGKGLRIYDCGSKGYKLVWYNNWYPGGEVFPMNKSITEHYYQDATHSNPNAMRLFEMMEKEQSTSAENRLYGCWRKLGEMSNVDGLDLLVTTGSNAYRIFGKEQVLQVFNLTPNGLLQCNCLMRPVKYEADTQFTADNQYKIEWVNDNTIRMSYNYNGKTVVELWKRSGLPKNLQEVLGTDVKEYKLNDESRRVVDVKVVAKKK